MSGPSADLDPRFDAFRPDLAEAALADRLFAPHYVEPVSRSIKEAASLHVKPDLASETIGQLEAGEAFALLEIAGDWAWGYRESDHLVGYLQAARLAPTR